MSQNAWKSWLTIVAAMAWFAFTCGHAPWWGTLAAGVCTAVLICSVVDAIAEAHR